MNHILYISQYVIILPIIIQAHRSYFSISNPKLNLCILANSNVFSCSSMKQDLCVKEIFVTINSHKIQFSNPTTSDVQPVDVDGLTEITADVDFKSNSSSNIITFKKEYRFTADSKEVTLNFTNENDLLMIGLIVACQPKYQGSKCDELKLCFKLPSNMCLNNGSCYEENGTIKCRCIEGFKGDVCQELEKPCVKNACRKNSECVVDYRETLQYRCKCTDKYKGQFCEEIVNPCVNNSCSKYSNCVPDNNERLQYRCQCFPDYTGRFCSMNIDKCAQNASFCTHINNATCIMKEDGPYCYCGCNSLNMKTTTSMPVQVSFKLPLSQFTSFIVIVIEAMIIVILIIVIISVKVFCTQPIGKRDTNNLLSIDDNKYELEFGADSKRTPIKIDKIYDRQSMNLLYEGHDLKSFCDTQPATTTLGKSTFGKG